jgi:S1-C subfamily serine protease
VKTDGGVPRDHVERGLLFSPDGKYLLVRYHGPHLEAVKQPLSEKIYRFPLLFTQDERARIARGPQPPPLDPTLAAALASPEPLLGEKIPRESIGALLKRDRKESTPKQISREHSDGVVVVKSGRATASGFIVGKQGYILTCAHVLHPFRAPTVTYRPVAGGKPETVESAVVAFDDERDLAVLKIVPNAALKEVPLAMDATVETGESVTVIGNPGVGETILANSLTTGVVSSADREIEKRHFLQTTAAVNPGNSGGPMFNSEGQVIGVVVAKANIEGTAFAVPLGEILAFFKENTAAAKK